MVPAYEVRRMGAGEVLAVDLGSYIDRPQHAREYFRYLPGAQPGFTGYYSSTSERTRIAYSAA